ncbi:unnamed protein product [Mytilus edulis]|uniref:Reverse transcriptase domain-containing protein n=1 Tax=Mytilus edulis TaxID=6550 RepID=A0A8S3QD19_MYTED|nr:unnamed protein product [Mytilus edulis]
MKPPKRLRKPKGIAGKSPNKKKKTQGTLPELAGVTDKETVPFQVDIGSISVASGSDQPNLAPVDQTPGQHMAYVMAGNDQHQVPRQPTTGMFNNTGLSDCNRGYAQGLNLEIVHESVTPMYTSSVFDSVGAHIPVKIKEKIWAGEYIDLNILLKSAKDLATDSQLNGDLSVKGGGLLTITPQRQSTITNLHVWTSAFIIFMDIVLEKWPNKGQEFLKYMFNVRLASSRGYGSGWAIYDEQYRLRKARCPQSSWAELDMELWVMYVSTPPRFAHSDTNSFGGHKGSQYVQNTKPEQVQRPTAACKGYNFGRCALETTLLGPAKRGKDYELYSLGYSPICVNEVEESLKFYPYKVIANELIHGLRFGFKLQYSGSRLPVNANNSKSVTIHADLVREKINKEITLGRMAGPFDHPPLPTLRISPIFLAEKKNGDYRLIHNLSYPLHNSVNDFIDEKYCSVQYSGIDDAVRLVQNIGIAGKLSKSDVKSAFRLLRVSPSDFDQLGFIFDGKYYFDRCLPQGASISCSLFEKFSTALHWVTELTSGNSNILHYLDDFLFGGEANSPTCQETLETFKKICSDWGVPLAEDKTVQPTEILTFLGIEFDTLKMEMRLPGEKLTNLKQTLQLFLHSKKVTLRQLQSLIGVKTIWLIGSSIVYWANKEASSRPGGLHLGLQNTGAHMIWIGQRGMKWGDLNTVFEQRLLNRPLPSFLVIQLGSNDLGISTSEKLFSDIECDLLRLHALYPALKIIWSDILMRRYWHNANCGQAIERARKRVNLRVKNLVLSIGGCAIRHSNIRAKESNLFRYDGTHLSKIGNDIYLNNLQGALEQFMRSGGPAVFPQ